MGPAVRRIRMAMRPRMKLTELAVALKERRCPLSESTLSKIENQMRGVQDYEAYALALALGVPVGDLYSK